MWRLHDTPLPAASFCSFIVFHYLNKFGDVRIYVDTWYFTFQNVFQQFVLSQIQLLCVWSRTSLFLQVLKFLEWQLDMLK